MPQKLLTVSEVVDACAPPDDQLRTTWLRRLRDWSSIGLLDISERDREGTGRHRLYSPDTVYVAAVLLRMADLGVPVGPLTGVARLVQHPTRATHEQKFRRFWAASKKAEGLAHLAIRPVPRPGTGALYLYNRGPVFTDDDSAWVTINLSAVFSRLRLP